jgi:hypothetical protein
MDHLALPAVGSIHPIDREQAMSMPDGAMGKEKYDRLKAKADADRAGRSAGRKPLVERLLDRLRPHRKEPGSDPQAFPGTISDPGD